MTLSAGTRLGAYEIVAPLGAGGMGEVYRARDTRLGRDVAIKVLPAHLSSHADARARFEREAKTVSSLNHPHICTLHDIGREGDIDYLVMELIDGETLADRLARGALPVAEVLRLGAQIADALDWAHRAGVVHRDLKPGNVMLTRAGAKLMDFGLARASESAGPISASGVTMAALTQTAPHVSPLTAEGTLVGTFQYMAPEQLEGKEADARSDIWALGCVLYEMATGTRAFSGDSQASLIAAIMTGTPRAIAELQPVAPATLDRIVARCLEKKPDERFRSAHDLRFALESLVAPSTAAAPAPQPQPAAPSSPRRAPRLRTPLLALAALVLLAAVFVVARLSAGGGRDGFAYSLVSYGRQAIFQARFAPDGKTIVLSAARNGARPELFVIRPDSPEQRPLGLTDTQLLSVSSKGELAVLTGARYLDHHRLFTGTLARMPLEGGAPRPLLEGVVEADWTPDGSALAIIREKDGLYRLEYPIGTVLASTSGYFSDLRVSPRGDRIAFFHHQARYDDRGTVNVVTRKGESKALTEIFSQEEGLTWSADGRVILFGASLHNEPPTVRAVDLRGHQRNIIDAPGDLSPYDTSPQGAILLSRETWRLSIAAKAPGASREIDLSLLDSGQGNRLSADGRLLVMTDQSASAGSTYTTCLRPTDGSPLVRLGEGGGGDISHDGAHVLATVRGAVPHLVTYPTGAGEAVRIDLRPLTDLSEARFCFNSRSVLVMGAETGKPPRCYLTSLNGGGLRAVTPPGTWDGFIAPDGLSLVARTAAGWSLLTAGAGDGRAIPGIATSDQVLRWSVDGRGVFVSHFSDMPPRIREIDPRTGAVLQTIETTPADLAGAVNVISMSVADDPHVYSYTVQRDESTLYLAEKRR